MMIYNETVRWAKKWKISAINGCTIRLETMFFEKNFRAVQFEKISMNRQTLQLYRKFTFFGF